MNDVQSTPDVCGSNVCISLEELYTCEEQADPQAYPC